MWRFNRPLVNKSVINWPAVMVIYGKPNQKDDMSSKLSNKIIVRSSFD